jgi:hypothetical protein
LFIVIVVPVACSPPPTPSTGMESLQGELEFMYDKLRATPTVMKTEAVFGLAWDPAAAALTVRLHSRGVPFDAPVELRHGLAAGSDDVEGTDPRLDHLLAALAPAQERYVRSWAWHPCACVCVPRVVSGVCA